jgi:hypothetical protein
MSDEPIERRLERLERELEELRSKLAPRPRQPGRDDWKSTIGAFADDPVAAEIIDEALRLREDERRQFRL